MSYNLECPNDIFTPFKMHDNVQLIDIENVCTGKNTHTHTCKKKKKNQSSICEKICCSCEVSTTPETDLELNLFYLVFSVYECNFDINHCIFELKVKPYELKKLEYENT